MPRNSAGTYTLPAGNPVVTGTTISSTWANTTLSDISSEMTDSLDRSGKGAMLAPLQLTDGTVGIPSLTFALDPDTGIFRANTNDMRLVAGGVSTAIVRTDAFFTRVPLWASDGLVGSPGISFEQDPDTGLYRSGANVLAVTTNGVQAARWDTVNFFSLLAIANQDGTAPLPGYSFFNDPDTGIYRSTTNELSISTAGSAKVIIGTTAVQIPSLLIYAADGAVGGPGYAFNNDPDTGIYRVGTNTMGFVAGGAFVAGIRASQIAPVDGSVGTPCYSFDVDPDTGIYRGGTNTLAISAGGVLQMQVDVNGAYHANGTLALPGISFNSDTDTGLFRSGANQLTLVAGATSIATASATDFSVGVNSFTFGTLNAGVLTLNVTTTAGATAGGGVLPATPRGFIGCTINGTARKIPYYDN